MKQKAQGRPGFDRVETLQALRLRRRMTQVKLAKTLNVTQATLSKLERRTDVKLSTLRAFVESLGGELQVVAKFDEQSVVVELAHDPAPVSR